MTALSMETAQRIWTAHREIEVGKKLLSDIRETLENGHAPTPADDRGSYRRGYQLGVPSNLSGHRLLDVSPRLAACIIEAHIAEKQRELEEASIAAKVELGT